MIKKILTPALLALIVLIGSCKDDITKPEPGRRDYEWTIDTLNYPYNAMLKIWGSSPTDVWTINGGNFDKTIFHYDGKEWTTDGKMRWLSPHSLWGFAANDVWIGGMNGQIWHYDGTEWAERVVLTINNNIQVIFNNMWGDAPNNLFAFGAFPDSQGISNNAVIAHYNNNNWEWLNTEGIRGIIEQLYIDQKTHQTYLQVIQWGDIGEYDSTVIYKNIQGKFNRIYCSMWGTGSSANISLINGEVYFLLGNKISKRINNNFQTVFQIDKPNIYDRFWGRSSNDIFLSMTDGMAHYNGNSIEYLYYFSKPNTMNFGAVIFDEEVFFLVHEYPTNLNLIYHGRLNKGE
jgi:hypothetical protein